MQLKRNLGGGKTSFFGVEKVSGVEKSFLLGGGNVFRRTNKFVGAQQNNLLGVKQIFGV